jgi:predicted DCC family thiol-disulfide oxidoreductase YuxK
VTRARLVYDSDCRFCTATARWVERHAPDSIQALPFDDPAVPSALAADRRHAHLIEGASVLHGGAAVTGALRHVRGGRAATILDRPGARWIRDVVYRAVARRHGSHVETARATTVAPPR